MAVIKPSIPKGTRDFSPAEMVKRNFIFQTISSVFRKFGYQEIQTPTMENLSTLTGKYGEEGDKLIFKVLNSGDFLSSVPKTALEDQDFNFLSSKISEKALRYDLTVPFARYVVMHRNEITFPFKRFQIQPVWRADRPQRGRYREFYQCDADVVGSESLISEAEFILIYSEALALLGLKDFTVKLNNRKILSGIADLVGRPDLLIEMTVAIDKLDKIGFDGVVKELLSRGFNQAEIDKLQPVILLEGSNVEKLARLKEVLQDSENGRKGIEEVETILNYLAAFNPELSKTNLVELDITLARGLNYYTGAIFEVKSNEVSIGSIGGGGRYDDLTGMFGLSNITGVGISFGADRIYDVMEELNLFPASSSESTRVLISNFDEIAEAFALPILNQLRLSGINSEIYPSATKLKKQMNYADEKKIPYVILIGSEELESNLLTLKDMKTGEQKRLSPSEIISFLSDDVIR